MQEARTGEATRRLSQAGKIHPGPAEANIVQKLIFYIAWKWHDYTVKKRDGPHATPRAMATNRTGPCEADETPSKERQFTHLPLLGIIQSHPRSYTFRLPVDVPNSSTFPDITSKRIHRSAPP